MNKLPRDLNGKELARALQRLGYGRARQSADHLRLTTQANGEHHVTIPDHRPLRRERSTASSAMWPGIMA